jgi:hypothetical protein
MYQPALNLPFNPITMKLVTHLKDGHEQLAMLIDGVLYDTDTINNELPSSMAMFLNYWDDMLPIALSAEKQIKEGSLGKRASTSDYETGKCSGACTFPYQLSRRICFSPTCSRRPSQ